MPGEKGAAGAYEPLIIDKGALLELREVLGPPPFPGQKMAKVNLMTGEVGFLLARRKFTGGKKKK